MSQPKFPIADWYQAIAVFLLDQGAITFYFVGLAIQESISDCKTT